MRRVSAAAICGFFAIALFHSASAGTTGGITGRVTDAATHTAIAGATVVATSPSQTATTTSDANGGYRFLSLAPDTYVLQFRRDGYDTIGQPGVSVFADQVQTFNVGMNKTLKTIAQVTARSAADLIKPGSTSDVYSINSAGQKAAASLIGPGGLTTAYGAIASAPGVMIDQGEQGWFQTVHIRGGDIDQIGYELDGIPVNRVYDNAPQTMLGTLGSQEVQVYTGGTLASADAQGISGYVNQVAKTGTYPGFGEINLGIGGPAFFHHVSVEAGGSTPNRNFSYYVGIGGSNQDFRYINNSNGAGQPDSFFYPVNAIDNTTGAEGPSGVYVLGDQPNLFASGIAYGIASLSQRDSIVNLHFGLPHKDNMLRDDVQLLYLNSEVLATYYSSQNDLGSAIANCACGFGQLVWDDGNVYTGQMFQPFDPAKLTTYFYPSSPQNRPTFATLPAAVRDSNDNGVSVIKAQYQKNFSSSAYLRLYGYSLYSRWFINGPNSAAQPLYGAELADYEIPDHSYGGNLTFTDQFSDKHLLSATAMYTQSNLQRYSNGFVHSNLPVAWALDGANNCVDSTGVEVGCYSSAAQTLGAATTAPVAAPPAGSQWIALENGYRANLNQAHTRFSAISLSDQWRPSDAWTVNLGLRSENFKYVLGDTRSNDPARAFWFSHYNAEHCFSPSTGVFLNDDSTTGAVQACPAGTTNTHLVDKSGGTLSTTRFEPRLGFTYTLNRDTVIRGSFGVYARPQNSSWVQYNTVQEDLASFLGSHFYSYGFTSPEHDIRPDTSYNADLSLEKRLKGTDWSFKLTPFYRSTKDQLQNFFIDPLTGLESGLNVGHQISSGVEVAIRKGDFARNGWSGQLAYTYTRSRIKYQNFPGLNRNVIDNLNGFIQQYNSYTSACTSGSATLCGGNSANAIPAFTNNGVPIANPYYNQPAQPLLDRNAYYTTYDVIPGPVSAENGYEVPHVVSLILNYRHDKFAITPSFTYSSGASYGAPLSWPGYLPDQCTAVLTGTQADPASCGSSTGLPLFIPDPYNGNKFDNLGQFKEPWRIGANLAMSYDLTKKMTAELTFTNVVDHCGQRGYAWDASNVCVYAGLPTGILYPAGNFYPNSHGNAPVQMKYPYSFWLNNNNTGFVGTKLPLQFSFNLQMKL